MICDSIDLYVFLKFNILLHIMRYFIYLHILLASCLSSHEYMYIRKMLMIQTYFDALLSS